MTQNIAPRPEQILVAPPAGLTEAQLKALARAEECRQARQEAAAQEAPAEVSPQEAAANTLESLGFKGAAACLRGQVPEPDKRARILIQTLRHFNVPSDLKGSEANPGVIRLAIATAWAEHNAKSKPAEKPSDNNDPVADLERNGCARAAVAIGTLTDAIRAESQKDVAGVLWDLGSIHGKRNQILGETVMAVDTAAEDAAAYLFGIFFALVQAARELFAEAGKAFRDGSRLRSDGFANRAVEKIREAKKLAFGDKHVDPEIHSVFGRVGCEALGRLIAKGQLPGAVMTKLRMDAEFAQAVCGDGYQLLQKLVAKPEPRHDASAKKTTSPNRHRATGGAFGKKGK